MARGGRRPGAGRPKGAVSRMSDKARAAASQTGVLPHEFLLGVMRGNPIGCNERPSLTQRLDAAKAAAPYFAPRIASFTHNGAITMEPSSSSDLETARRLAFLTERLARDIEARRPDLRPIDRQLVFVRILDEFVATPTRERSEIKTGGRSPNWQTRA